MLRKVSTVTVLGLIACLIGRLGVVGQLTVSPEPTNGVLTVCPGDPISITCTHDNIAVTRWEVSGIASEDCLQTVSHLENAPDTTCGLFMLTMISESSVAPFNSTAQTTATEALNGAVVECFSLDSLIGNVTINVLGIPTSNVTSVEQVSQSMVRVSMSMADSQCVGSYLVEATPVGGSGSTNTSSPTPTVDVSGLDVCQYNYSFVGSILTPGGVQGELSSPVSFSANLSVLNGITVTINQEDPLIQWVQQDNPLYPTCIIEYLIEDQVTSFNATVSPTVRSLTAQQLNETGFPYCTTIQPTVTPITPMGPLETVQGSGNLNTVVTDPDFPTPMFSYAFSLLNETVTLRINFPLTISNTTVPTRSYQYSVSHSTVNEMTSNTMSFIGDYFEFELSTKAGQAGRNISVTVTFQRDACRTMKTATVIVPARTIEGATLGTPTDTSQTVTITLPLTEYEPEQLLIISTVSAPGEDEATVMADFTSPSARYTATFTDLNPDTEYTFTIKIVLRSDNTVDVVQAVSGAFTTAPTTPPTTEGSPSPAPTGCDGGCIAGIIIAILVVIAIIAIVVVVVVVCLVVLPKQKEKAAGKGQEPGKQEMSTIESPETVKVEIVPDPVKEDNQE